MAALLHLGSHFTSWQLSYIMAAVYTIVMVYTMAAVNNMIYTMAAIYTSPLLVPVSNACQGETPGCKTDGCFTTVVKD